MITENKNEEIGKDTEKEKTRNEGNVVTIYNTNSKLEIPSTSNLLNNPSDFIISQNPLEDLSQSNFAIIHIKNTLKNSCCNCYINCCCGHSIIFNTFLNINLNMKFLFQSSAIIIPDCTCCCKRNIELQATFNSFTKSSPEEISSNGGNPYAAMDKIDAFSCCNYKEEIVMPVKIIPENRIAGTVVLKPLKDKCPCGGCNCLLYYCCFPCFPFIPCLSDCCPECNPKSDSEGCNCNCCSDDPNRCCCGICPKSDCGCNTGFDCTKCCSDDPKRCCCGICLKPNCCCCDDNRCCCGICPKTGSGCECEFSKCCSNDPNRCCCGICLRPNCCCCDPNRCCCGLCPKPTCCNNNNSCCCCCCCCCGGGNGSGNYSSDCCCKTYEYYCEIYDVGNVLKYYVLFDYKCKCGCKCCRRKMGLRFKIYDVNNNHVATISGINDNKNIGMFFNDSYSYQINFPSDATPDIKLCLLHCIYSIDTLCLY